MWKRLFDIVRNFLINPNPISNDTISNNVMPGTGQIRFLLKEDGFFLLKEDGNKIILEI